MNESLLQFISACPTAYHAVEHTAALLDEAGFHRLSEHDFFQCLGNEHFPLLAQGYYVIRNGSSLIAFYLPLEQKFRSIRITAAHGDSPAFKIKENAELCDGHTLRLSVEKYGGMLCATWMDRPLSVAGRVTVRTLDGLAVRNVDLKKPMAVIPSVAIHMNRSANESASYNPAVDMIPLCGEASDEGLLRRRVAEELGVSHEDILTTDLFLYNPDPGMEWNGYVSAPRLDDLQCAYASLSAFMQSGANPYGEAASMFCLFDNEEVGSQTKQGAASTFLYDVISVICESAGYTHGDMTAMLSDSFMISCDNAHAVHPNHPEYQDKNHAVYMNGGVVIKYNANQRYTTDAVSAGLFELICERAGVPIQRYANRADMLGGSTLGSISNTKVSVNTVDVGLAQLAMHSAYETAGARDTAYLTAALNAFYRTELYADGEGGYHVCSRT